MIDSTEKTSSPIVAIRVELFGSARMVCGKRLIEVELPERARICDVTSALAKKCPELLGKAILEDASGLLESFTLNINGTEFISSDEGFCLKQGDTLLMFSSQAGG